MKLKPLVIMMTILPAVFLPTSTAIFASDLTIYKGNTDGKTNIFLMLDTSGSMGISSLVLPKNNQYGSPGDVEESLCNKVDVPEATTSGTTNIKEWAYNLIDTRTGVLTSNKTAVYQAVTIGGEIIPYYVRGCTKKINGKTISQYDRLSRLKSAILPLLASNKLDNDVVMGLGNFSAKTNLNVSGSSIKLVDGHSGTVLVPNGKLTVDQRKKIAKAIAQFKSLDTTTNEDGSPNGNLKLSSKNYPDVYKSSSGTPTAHAYAEAAAYMMGRGTGVDSTQNSLTRTSWVYDGYMVMQNNSTKEQVYFICVALGLDTTTSAISAGGKDVKQCVNNWPGYDSGQKTVSAGNINDNKLNGGVLKPDGRGGWTKITSQAIFKNDPAVKAMVGNTNGNMSTDWDVYDKLPIGWRYGGWMKVDNEPLDIEPIVGTVYGGYTGPSSGLVSYRTNPFALVEQAAANSYTDNLVGGFRYSVAESKKTDGTNTYIAGGSTSSCDGNGIYFLTDGAPNSTKDVMAQTIMNTSLTSTYAFNNKPSGDVLKSPDLKSDLFAGETGGWEYIGAYAKKLVEPNNNPGKMKIRTAVVGFGASFEGLTKNADGSYDCDSTDNLDIKNACKWGSNDYGAGGFYQATNSDDIADSIVDFVNKVKVDFTPSSLGSISVPRDPLDQTKYLTEGFFPMVMPMEDISFRTWAGNLKKYNIIGGTLKDKSNNAIFTMINGQQVINSNAKDLWSQAAAGTDHSLVNSGGAWNQIPVPSSAQEAVDSISNINSQRKVYTMNGSSLKKVTTTNLATNISGDDAFATGSLTVNQRLALLNYLGYKTTFPTAQTTLTATDIAALAINPVSPYRYLGGVVHSTPLMVTKESTVSGSNVVGTRKEYTVYGSMDGGLHIVDASTGKEQSVFIPKEILDNQYDTLASVDSKGVGTLTGLVYGVDAPWTTDNTFQVKTDKTGTLPTTKYIANKMNIYGGLRMGGEAIYGLDILDPTAPKLLFNITPTKAGFGRLAQIWSKPTVAEIRVKGERKKVLIFGGGYDAAVYEKPSASFTEPSSTKGNALYIVDAKTGDLIWMSSSDTSGVANTYQKTGQADLKYSVVGQPVVRDYDADGLTDMIYFADLGGQVFRVDLDNNTQMSTTVNQNIAVRVQPLAQLRTTGSPAFVPRFYDRLSTAVFDEGQNRFVLVTAGSGNRSFPLEEEKGGKNKMYGLIDRDAAANGLEKSSFVLAPVITPALLSDTGVLGKTVTKQISDADIARMKLTTGNTALRGWSFELRSVDSGNYARSFEESQLITGDLYMSLYDPKATLTGTVSGCGGGVTGISTTHRICMPYGDCAAYVKTSYQGINGPAFGVVSAADPRTTSLIGPIAETREACVGNCPTKNATLIDKNIPAYSQVRKIKPVRWFEW